MHLSIAEIQQKIKSGETFAATTLSGGLTIKINKYVPFLCTAIHDGSELRPELKQKSALNDYERWYEEDPFTGLFIDSMPITIVGHDSRFEYDLNRAPSTAIYEEAWGKVVWKKKLSKSEKDQSLQKHAEYYSVLKCLVHEIEEKFGSCLLFDMHSYNYKRWKRQVPLFNIGIENVDSDRFKDTINNWKEALAEIEVPNEKSICAINDVFYGRGYNAVFIKEHFKNTLVLPTEVKKVYCNEETGEEYPEIIQSLQIQLKDAILNTASAFTSSASQKKTYSSLQLLDKKEDPALFKVDRQLYQLLKSFELLAYVNPNNSKSEYAKFLKNKFTTEPKFKYRPIKFNSYELKSKLARIPVQNISDISIREIYLDTIQSFQEKIDLLSTLGSSKFKYNSMAYFGKPSAKDIKNAHYLLHLPKFNNEAKTSRQLGQQEVFKMFENTIDEYGLQAKVTFSKRVISQVMVINSLKQVLIRPDAKFTVQQIKALLEHEIGVHMVTTNNANMQRLKILELGMPVNTKTQEGLAILSEYLSGSLSLHRLKKLALRVIAVDKMCSGASFSECFNYILSLYKEPAEDVYTLCTRVYRGGGFTKDFLYLSGFVDILKAYKNGDNLDNLLCGKTSLEYKDTIDEMVEREILVKPKFITKSFENPKANKNQDILEYILSGLI